ncbi:MAG TPA: GAF domain-containing protein [Chloroflexi bacterium]|nr:GAF domain-containing protein [Chloroflexota bacterium]
MSKDDLRHSLEELFSNFKPPSPEGKEEPAPPPPEPESPLPSARPQPPTLSGPPTLIEPPSAREGEGGEEELPSALIGARVTSVRDRLIGIVLVISTLLVVATLLIFTSIGEMEKAVAALHEDSARLAWVLKAHNSAVALIGVLQDEAASQDPVRFVERTKGALEALDQTLAQVEESAFTLPPDDTLRSALIQFRDDLGSVRILAENLLEEARQGNWGAVYDYTRPEYLGFHRSRITNAVEEVQAAAFEREESHLARIEQARETVRTIPVVWGSVIALTLIGTAVATIRSIAQPIERLTEATARLATGHLEERVPVERADEFGRLAAAFNKMAEELQAYYTELEERVAERTRALQEANAALQRRAVLLEASAEIGRVITSIFDVDELLRRTVNLIRERFGFYHAGIFLIDESGEWAVLREATGEAGEKMKAQGHRLRVGGTSMVGWTALHRKPRIALDVGEDAVHFDNPLLPYTRSEVTLPLMVGGRLLGVLDVQSTEEAAFNEDDVRALQSMADQIAVALENARRLSDEALLLEATSPIYRASRRLTTATTLEEVSEVVIATVAETGVDGCIIALFEPPGAERPETIHFIASWRRDEQTTIPPGIRVPISASHMRVDRMQRLWSLADVQSPSFLTEEEIAFFRRAGVGAVANIPLRIGERPIGFVVAYRLRPGAFPESALRLYEALIDQASLALERARLLEATRRRVEIEATLRALSDRLARAVDMGTVLRSVAEGLGEALHATGVYVELGPGMLIDRSAGGEQ